jgi:transcriptional regulator with XRE-family HTH domain
MSQSTLAKKARISQAYLSRLEAGVQKNPSVAVLRRLARALAVPVTSLLRQRKEVGMAVVEKERLCKGCGRLLYKTGPLDETGEHWGLNMASPVTDFEHDEQGFHMRCPHCGTKLRFIDVDENRMRPAD